MAEDSSNGPTFDDEAGTNATESQSLFGRLWPNSNRKGADVQRNRCVIIGPTASGKTLMLVSLGPGAVKQMHSYSSRLKVTLQPNNKDFRDLENRREEYFPDGLMYPAQRYEECFQPEFTLFITDKKTNKQRYTRFRTFDGPGGLIVDDNFDREDLADKAKECRAHLQTALGECETVMLCLPIVKHISPKEQEALNWLIHEFLINNQIRDLVICMTMYEKLGINLGRHAFRRLANRSAARENMRTALRSHLSAVNQVLSQFHRPNSKRNAWCVPISTYGFIPNNGGANVERIVNQLQNEQVEEIERLRVWPTLSESPHPSLNSSPPYDENMARYELWRPFLTLDPFIFIATGNRDGTLIHRYNEIFT